MNLRVLGVLAGEDLETHDLAQWVALADVVYAADSAADRLVKIGCSPTIVGDLDSVSAATLQAASDVHRNPDTESTDCDKMLSQIQLDGHVAATLISVEGDLMDHVLASLGSVARNEVVNRVVLRRSIVTVVRPNQIVAVPDCFGRRVSLIPVGRATGVCLEGVVWPVEEAVMEPFGFISVSNEGTGTVTARLSTGVGLLFTERLQNEIPIW